MKFSFKIIAVFLLGLTLTNCTDLDTENSDFLLGDQYPENELQAIRVANPVFTRTQGLLDWGGWWFTQEIPSDEAVAPTRGADWDDGGKWRVLHQHTWGSNTEAVTQLWNLIYDAVPRANRAIELLEVNADGNDEIANVLAQTIVARAFYYYLAIDNFGDVPFPRTFTGAEQFPSRTARAEVFNAIVQDILDNVDKLSDPTPGTNASSINKGTAYTLLAKLYLNAEVYTGTPRWQDAIDAADMVMSFGYSLDANALDPFKIDNVASTENIYTIAYDEDNFNGFNLHMRSFHYLSQQTFGMAVQPWNGFAVQEEHYNTFTANDVRAQEGLLVGQQFTLTGEEIIDDVASANLILTPNIPALLMDAGSFTANEFRNSGVRVAKWQVVEGATDNLSNDFPIFRLADVMLTKAEALKRLNQDQGTVDNLMNQIKTRANAPTTGNYTLDEILEERGRELLWEGYRRQDLIRYNRFNQAWWEKNASDPTRNIFPIPESARNANGNLGQNPGY
ncbi:RagB/SusD family nutrient uptake outer membrane protein [Aquimarina rhabdastrellae]